MKKKIKTKKTAIPELTNEDKKFLRLVRIAQKIVLKEDEALFKELAKY